MATEKHCLPPVIPKSVPSLCWQISTLRIVGSHTSLEILTDFMLEILLQIKRSPIKILRLTGPVMMRLAFNQISQYGPDMEGEKRSNLHLFQPVGVW